MEQTSPFAEALIAVDQLSLEDQEALVTIVRRRVAEEGRRRIAADIREAEEEFAAGKCHPISVDDLMAEIRN